MRDIAIAIGPNSEAVAEGGFGDFASAVSTGSDGATGNNFDFATASGNESVALAGNSSGGFPDTTGSSFDFASAAGHNGPGAGSVAEAGFNGSGDSASAVGQNVAAVTGATSGQISGNHPMRRDQPGQHTTQ